MFVRAVFSPSQLSQFLKDLRMQGLKTLLCTETLYGVSKRRFREGGEKLDRRRAKGVLFPCTRESQARNRQFSEAKSDLGQQFVFFLRAANKEHRAGKIPGTFLRDAQGFGRPDAGSLADFTTSRPPSP